MKNTIVKNQNIEIDTQTDNKILKLTINIIESGISVKKYFTEITEEEVCKSFENFSQFQNHLAGQEYNYEIRRQQKILIIKSQTNIANRKTLVNLLTLQLKQMDPKPANALQFILMKCMKPGELSNEEVKQMFKHIGFYLKKEQQKRMGKNTKTEEYKINEDFGQSLINKIKIVSQDLENMKKSVTEKLQYLEKDKNREIEELQLKLDSNLSRLRQQNKNVEEEVSKIQGAFHQFICETMQSLNKNKQNSENNFSMMSTELKRLSKQYQQSCIMQSQFAYSDDIKQIQAKINSLISQKKKEEQIIEKIEEIVNFPPNQKKQYQVKGSQIIKVSDAAFHNSGILANLPISKKNQFAFKIIKTENNGVSVGIKDVRSNQFIKFGGNGWIINCGTMIYGQGRGLTSGDTVKILVNLSKNVIFWKVENKQNNYKFETKCQNTKIGLKQKQWFPFITLMQKDAIQIIE